MLYLCAINQHKSTMKFSGAVEIDKPREEVARFFADPQYLGEYQDGFVKKELNSGEAGADGAISTMYYKQGKLDMVLTETIVSNQLPERFEAFYHHKHMDNTMRCTFTELGPNKTRYAYEGEYTRIEWFMPKLIAILFPGMYRKQVEKWMRQFKEFVEQQ